MQITEQAHENGDAIDLMINMGPQHPSTHGVFRLVIWVDGERITKVEPHIGYLHRGSEKLCEGEQYSQIITLFDRLDYVGNLNGELAFCLAVEKLMGLEIPDRANYIRVILCELNRIASHMLFYGVYGLDVGAMTPILYGFRERERIQSLLESVTGARMMHNYIRVGGVKDDLPDDFDKRMAVLTDQLKQGIEECDGLLSNNEMFLARTKGIGTIDGEDAIDYGVSGPALRASGVLEDVRISEPYSIYDRFDFGIPVGTYGGLLGQVLRARGRDAAVAGNHRAGHATDGAGTHNREGQAHRPPSQGGGIHAHREPTWRFRCLSGQRRQRQALSRQGEGPFLRDLAGAAPYAAGCVCCRRGCDPWLDRHNTGRG